MSIFVEDCDAVEVVVHYSDLNGKIEILETPSEKSQTLKMMFRRPDFAISQRLMSACTVPDQNGAQTVNVMLLQNNMMYMLAKSWNAKTQDVTIPEQKSPDGTVIPAKVIPGNPIELNNENISKLRVEISRALVNALIPAIGQIV